MFNRDNKKRWQLKCKKCGSVKQITGGEILVMEDRICDDCKYIINESDICEIKQEFLLE